MNSANGDLNEFYVEGSSYEPVGAIQSPDGKEFSNLSVSNAALYELAQISSCCNYSQIAYDEVCLSPIVFEDLKNGNIKNPAN